MFNLYEYRVKVEGFPKNYEIDIVYVEYKYKNSLLLN